jgi:hypothetical protein
LLNNTFFLPYCIVYLYFSELNRKFRVNKSYVAAGYCHLHLSNFKHDGSHMYHLLSYLITAFYKHVGSNIISSELFFFRRFHFGISVGTPTILTCLSGFNWVPSCTFWYKALSLASPPSFRFFPVCHHRLTIQRCTVRHAEWWLKILPYK